MVAVNVSRTEDLSSTVIIGRVLREQMLSSCARMVGKPGKTPLFGSMSGLAIQPRPSESKDRIRSGAAGGDYVRRDPGAPVCAYGGGERL